MFKITRPKVPRVPKKVTSHVAKRLWHDAHEVYLVVIAFVVEHQVLIAMGLFGGFITILIVQGYKLSDEEDGE